MVTSRRIEQPVRPANWGNSPVAAAGSVPRRAIVKNFHDARIGVARLWNFHSRRGASSSGKCDGHVESARGAGPNFDSDGQRGILKNLRDASATRYGRNHRVQAKPEDADARLDCGTSAVGGGGEVAVVAGLRRRPSHIALPSVSQVRELLVQQHAGLMRRLQFRGRTAGGRGARLGRRTVAAASPGSPPTTGTGRAAGGNGHVEVRLGVVDVHGPLFIDRVRQKLKRRVRRTRGINMKRSGNDSRRRWSRVWRRLPQPNPPEHGECSCSTR